MLIKNKFKEIKYKIRINMLDLTPEQKMQRKKEQIRKWNSENYDYMLEYHRKYSKTHKEYFTKNMAKYRAFKKEWERLSAINV